MDWKPNAHMAPGLGTKPRPVVHSTGEEPLRHLLPHICGSYSLFSTIFLVSRSSLACRVKQKCHWFLAKAPPIYY